MLAAQSHRDPAGDHNLLSHDLLVLEEMVARMPDYFVSEATRWDMGKDRPPLTIGGYLMRRRRLALLAEQLEAAEHERLTAANRRYDDLIAGRSVRYESRLSAEIGEQLREWTVYLRDLVASSRLAADQPHYIYKSDSRVVIDELMTALGPRLSTHMIADMVALDHRLRARWQPGAFIWAAVWQPAYPAERYWWLYGYPAAR